tara:strand:+ start:597 stop:1250 length:654 start_codon:yes stop_codon:yes gene_type:complete
MLYYHPEYIPDIKWEVNMTSKIIGSLLILGTILTMGVWMFFGVDTDNMSPSDKLNVLIANKSQIQIITFVTTFGFACLIIGLHYLSRKLSDHILSEIGGLILIAMLPLIISINMSDLVALESEKLYSNGTAIVTAATAFDYGFLAMMAGIFLIGAGLAIEKKIGKGIIGVLLAICSAIAILSEVGLGAFDAVAFIGWLGTWLLFLVTGIFVFLQEEN